jgi:hypothetical protein
LAVFSLQAPTYIDFDVQYQPPAAGIKTLPNGQVSAWQPSERLCASAAVLRRPAYAGRVPQLKFTVEDEGVHRCPSIGPVRVHELTFCT